MPIKKLHNTLKANKFTLLVEGYDLLSQQAHTITPPSIELETGTIPYQAQKIQSNTGGITFSPLVITFILDENMELYQIFLDWLGVSQANKDFSKNVEISLEKIKKDIKILLHTNQGNENREINYIGCFPTSVDLDPLSRGNPNDLQLTVSFLFDYPKFK